jgi:Domain of unknown function (DUF1793)
VDPLKPLKLSIPADWEIWTAAIATDTDTRDLFITSVKKWASDGLSSQPLGDWYETTNGIPEGFRARPVVGGHLGKCLSFLCLAPLTDKPGCILRLALVSVKVGIFVLHQSETMSQLV